MGSHQRYGMREDIREDVRKNVREDVRENVREDIDRAVRKRSKVMRNIYMTENAIQTQ